MAKEICSNCNAKMSQTVSFCPVCSRPTAHASETELLEWDLGQWRRHVERSVASGVAESGAPSRRSVVALAEPEAAVLPVAKSAPRVPAKPRAKAEERVPRSPRLRLPKPRLRLPARRPEPVERDRVIVLDADSAFVYTACTSCERADWIVRTRRNEDDTYNYWCVRCSRSFKTDARLPHGWKPFLASGSVIAALATLSIVMG